MCANNGNLIFFRKKIFLGQFFFILDHFANAINSLSLYYLYQYQVGPYMYQLVLLVSEKNFTDKNWQIIFLISFQVLVYVIAVNERLDSYLDQSFERTAFQMLFETTAPKGKIVTVESLS